MKNLFIVVAILLFGLSACDNGGYDADPDSQTNTPNYPVTPCNFTFADTNVCSCTDSLSWFANGVLESSPYYILAHLVNSGGVETALFIYDTAAISSPGVHLQVIIVNYAGPGEYFSRVSNDNKYAELVYYGPEGQLREGGDCPQVKVTITSDANGIVKGNFCGLVQGMDMNNTLDTVFVPIKGGQFTAQYQ